MGFLSVLGGGGNWREVFAAAPAADNGRVAYDPNLIIRLTREHRDMVNALAAIKLASDACRFDELPELLRHFKHAFHAHIAAENVKLYVYVQQRYGPDSETADFVFALRREMHGIARTLTEFINTHTAVVPCVETARVFRAELDVIGSLLLRRVHLEESRLYPLYRPA